MNKLQDNRISWDDYFMEFAKLAALRSTCLRLNVGAVLIKDNHIISTGYNGAPRNLEHCSELHRCLRQEQNIAHGQRYELCRSIHAEQNTIIQAALYGISTKDSILYCTDTPCIICAKMIINAGIVKIVVNNYVNNDNIIDILNQAGITMVLHKTSFKFNG